MRIIKEQSGWTTYQLDDSSIILWLVAPIVRGNIQVHYYRQWNAIMNVVTNLSTDDYIDLQKHVQLHGKNHIDDKELREISKL